MVLIVEFRLVYHCREAVRGYILGFLGYTYDSKRYPIHCLNVFPVILREIVARDYQHISDLLVLSGNTLQPFSVLSFTHKASQKAFFCTILKIY